MSLEPLWKAKRVYCYKHKEGGEGMRDEPRTTLEGKKSLCLTLMYARTYMCTISMLHHPGAVCLLSLLVSISMYM